MTRQRPDSTRTRTATGVAPTATAWLREKEPCWRPAMRPTATSRPITPYEYHEGATNIGHVRVIAVIQQQPLHQRPEPARRLSRQVLNERWSLPAGRSQMTWRGRRVL